MSLPLPPRDRRTRWSGCSLTFQEPRYYVVDVEFVGFRHWAGLSVALRPTWMFVVSAGCWAWHHTRSWPRARDAEHYTRSSGGSRGLGRRHSVSRTRYGRRTRITRAQTTMRASARYTSLRGYFARGLRPRLCVAGVEATRIPPDDAAAGARTPMEALASGDWCAARDTTATATSTHTAASL